jgi:hypothetical protein
MLALTPKIPGLKKLVERKALLVVRKTFNLVTIVLALIVALQSNVVAQTRTRNSSRTSRPPAPSLLASLPQSDAIAHVKVNRLLSEVMPRVFANNSAKLAELNTNIESFKTRTGLDPRSFDEIALSVRYTYPTEGVTKLVTAALAKGTFNAGAIVAAGRLASDGKYREEKYQGKPVYIFKLDESIRLFGIIDLKIRELAASPIDANTLALGDPTSVRSVIDAGAGRNQTNAELIALASGNPTAIIGFGGNISPQVLKNLDVSNSSLAGDLSGLRQAYGSIGANERDVEVFLGAKTVDTDAARNLGDTLEGLKQFGALFVGRLTGAKGVLAKSALTNLKIATQANELQIRTAVAQTDIGTLVGN